MDINELPNYLMSTDGEEDNIFETTYTDNPAVGFGFLMFNEAKEDRKQQAFKVIKDNEDYERVTSGVWMMPNTRYLRQTEEGDFYTVEFTAEDLQKALKKHLKTGYRDNTQLEHDGYNMVTFETLEYWIIRDKDTVSPIYGLSLEDLGYNADEIPAGTVMKTTFVSDEDFWNDFILTGKVQGYSIGGLFTMEYDDRKEEMNMESNQYNLFKAMGMEQSNGNVILSDDRILALSSTAQIDGNEVEDGVYQTKTGFALIIKEGQLADFSETLPNEAPIETSPSLGAETNTPEAVVDTTVETNTDTISDNGSDDTLPTDSDNNDAIEDSDSNELSVDKAQVEGNDDADRGVEATEKPSEDLNVPSDDLVQENPMEAIMARLEALEGKLAKKDEEISSLSSKLEAKEQENASLKETVNKQPIVKTKKNLNSLVGNTKKAPTEGKTTVKVGNKEFYV